MGTGAVFAKRLGQAGLVLALLAVGAIALAWLSQPAAPLERVDAAAARPRVTVVRARVHSVARQWRGHGTIEAHRAADVASEITAPVAAVPERVEPGARVERGELLVALEKRDLALRRTELTRRIEQRRAELERLAARRRFLEKRLALAEEEIEIAANQVRRYRELRKREAATERELDDARAALLRAERAKEQIAGSLAEIGPQKRGLEAAIAARRAARGRVERDLERARIASPIAGMIERVRVDAGEHVRAGSVVARVVGLDRVEARVRLPAAARGAIAAGDELTLERSGDGTETRSARIQRLSPADDPASRTLTAYALLKQAERASRWVPGTYVAASVRAAEKRERALVPQVAVRDGRLRTVVEGTLRERGGRIERVFRAPFPDAPERLRDWVSLSDPVEPGTKVVIASERRLAPGDRVRAVETGASP